MKNLKNNMRRGKFAGEVHRIVDGREIISALPAVVKQPNTEAQMAQRSKWPNVVAMYRAFKPYAKACFEGNFKGVKDYHRFMAANLMGPNVYVTKDIAKFRGGVAAPYVVSQGSLKSINVTGTGGEATTDIALGNLTITDSTTVKQFAEAVVTNNPRFCYNDQISYLLFRQEEDAAIGVPLISAEGYLVELNKDDERTLRSVAGSYGFNKSADGFLSVSSTVPQGTFAWVHSRKSEGGSTLVSSQRLIDNNPILANYTDSEAKLAAMQSYGLKETPFITPTNSTTGSTTSGGSSSSGNTPSGGGDEVDPDNPLG